MKKDESHEVSLYMGMWSRDGAPAYEVPNDVARFEEQCRIQFLFHSSLDDVSGSATGPRIVHFCAQPACPWHVMLILYGLFHGGGDSCPREICCGHVKFFSSSGMPDYPGLWLT